MKAITPKVLLKDLRELIEEARQDVARQVNSALVLLYWHVGNRIHQDILKERRAGYGDQIVSAVSRELAPEFGQGFSEKNLWHMIRFEEVFPDEEIVSALRRELSWAHFKQIVYLDDPLKRDFYAEMCRIERWEDVAATDYFPGPAKEQAQHLLSQAEASLSALRSPGEPQTRVGDVRHLNRADYQNRAWATRERPWVDRLAPAWLIRRFIDPMARFVWLKNTKNCPVKALGFDFDKAAFTHVGARVTFEVLLASFGLEKDATLMRLGSLVHYLDVGGVPVAEAPGLDMILNGARRQYDDDDKLLKEASKAFDFLYASYSEE